MPTIQPEYIEFSFATREQLRLFMLLFDQIKDIHNNEKSYQITSLLALIPADVQDYFTREEGISGWRIQNLIQYLIEDLDVFYLTTFEKKINVGRLEFESNGYPYGAPTSLIILLRSYGFIPFELDEGAYMYKILWASDHDFTLESITNHQKEESKIASKKNRPWWKFW